MIYTSQALWGYAVSARVTTKYLVGKLQRLWIRASMDSHVPVSALAAKLLWGGVVEVQGVLS